MATTRTINVGSMAPGINNQLPATELEKRLPDGTAGTFLYGADNVDINEKGYLKRRKGTTTMVPGPTHSLWSDKAGAFTVHEGTLKRIRVASPTSVQMEDIYAGLPRIPLSYSRGADGDVYWSNGLVIRRITASGDAPIATPPPNPEPSVAVFNGNSLPAGTYLMAFTRRTADGESPATPVQRVEVPEGGAIRVDSGVPVEVYMSAPNGDVLTLQASDAVSYTVYGYSQDRRRCDTLNKAVLPPGNIVRHYRGRMLVASNTILHVGDPYNYGLFDPSSGYILFPEPITVIEPVDNGVYICADKTYWIADLTDGDLQELLPHGGVLGTSGRSPNDEEVFWQSPNGLIIGDKNSSVKSVQAPAINFGEAVSGASLFREQDGMTQVISSRTSPSPSSAIATSYFEARVIQKGTEL